MSIINKPTTTFDRKPEELRNTTRVKHCLANIRSNFTTCIKNKTSEDNRSTVMEEVIVPREFIPTRSTQATGQYFYMRNYPDGNDQKYLSVEQQEVLKMTGTTTVDKCKFLVTPYPQILQNAVAVTFQHVLSSKYISSSATSGVELIDSTAPLIFQSTDSKLFYRHFDADLEHYYFESVTNQGYYLAYDRVTSDVTLLQLSADSIQDKTGNALDVFFKHVSISTS